jgi:two-component system, cell cycle sensor histidine kinase and response regulator CckA
MAEDRRWVKRCHLPRVDGSIRGPGEWGEMDKSGSAHRRIRSDEFSRLLFDEASDGFFLASAAGEYVEVNRSGHRMLGYAPGELVGKHVGQVIMPHDPERLTAAWAELTLGNTLQEIWPMVRKDGSVASLEVSAQLLSNGSVLLVVRDPRGRDEYEQQIQESEAKLRSLLRTAPDTIMTVDRAGKVLFINRTYAPFTVDNVVGASCFDFVPPESRARVAAAIEHVFSTRELDEYEVMTAPDADGERWSSVRAGPQIQGDEVVAVTLCASNISSYKREQARTRELLDRVAKIARLVPGMVYQYQLWPDGTACYPYASDRIHEIYGVAPAAVRDDDAAVWAALHPDDRERVRESLRASADSGEPCQQEYRVLLGQRELWLYDSAVPERQHDGSTLWHGFVSDVTEQKHAEQRARVLQEQLMQAQKMESVGQLAGGVAHDFNNLLTTVGAFVELAQEELPANARVREYLDGVLSATARGAELTQQLLAFARKKIVQPEPTDLNAVLTRMAPMLRRLVGEHITVELGLAPQLGAVKVDLGSIEQVIINLIVNARDAMPNGGRLLLDTHETDDADSVDGTCVAMSVTDTGTGMRPEIRARLFEPFFTTKAPGRGTGLGLAMCHGIVQQAGGQITVHSELGFGTRFTIVLPRQHDPVARSSTAPPPRTRSTGNETVLLVEDEAMILRVAKTALEKRGYHVLCASNGAEALELVRRTDARIDMLISDVVMPTLGGPELAARIGELRPAVKVLFTSGYAENQLGAQGVLRQGVNFIQKPYTFAQLAERVRELLDQPA